jgi:hypothetical protein
VAAPAVVSHTDTSLYTFPAVSTASSTGRWMLSGALRRASRGEWRTLGIRALREQNE